MREILFRGFHENKSGKEEIVLNGKKIRGEWVEGYYWTNELGNHFIKVVRDNENNFVKDPITNDYEVLKETVGQYTGLTDKNGNKIFEGDIVKEYDKELDYDFGTQTVIFDRIGYDSGAGLTGFTFKQEWLKNDDFTDCARNVNLANIEVIGNIF